MNSKYCGNVFLNIIQIKIIISVFEKIKIFENYIYSNERIQQTYDNLLIEFNKIYPCYMGKPIF